ncbi:MAG: methyltransferase family protein [Aestuariibacter sp.]
MKNLQLKIPPALLLLIFMLICWAIYSVVPALAGLPSALPYANTVSGLFLLMGLLVISAGVYEFRRFKTTVNPLSPEQATNMVRSGIFSFSRNPMYLGMLFILIATVINMFHLLTLMLIPAFVLYMNAFQIKPEERILKAQFGQEYEQYLLTTRRWL